jgi:hypothetical protein
MGPSPASSLPTSIDLVVARLDAIIDEAIGEPNRLGYFAALYNRVTKAVRAGISAGAFDDNPRMERLDVAFANRYLDAYGRYRRGQPVTASWRVAFDAAGNPGLSVLRHLVLGMNAHINPLLASLLPAVETQLGEIAPRLGAFSDLAHSADRLDERLGNFSMEKARDGAWRFARRLAGVRSPLAREVAIAARDGVVAALAVQLQSHELASDLISGPNREGIASHIRILRS